MCEICNWDTHSFQVLWIVSHLVACWNSHTILSTLVVRPRLRYTVWTLKDSVTTIASSEQGSLYPNRTTTSFLETRRRDATSDSEKNIKFAPYTRHNLETAITLLVLPIFLIHIKEQSKTSDTTRCNTLRLTPFSLANACLAV